LPHEYGDARNASIAIYYLLTPSIIHRVNGDGIFHFYAGDAVKMPQLWPVGDVRIIIICNDLAVWHAPQDVVPAGVWQRCRLIDGDRWALMGCTVVPGYESADYNRRQAPGAG